MTGAAGRAARGGTRPSEVQLFASTPQAPVRWRLLSGNNREAGRGPAEFVDADQCLGALRCIQNEAHRLSTRVSRVEPNRWVWQVSIADEPVAVAARPFDRQIRCQQALAQFLDDLPEAQVRTSVMISGARRWSAR